MAGFYYRILRAKINLEDNIFEIINHLNQCHSYLTDSEKIQLAEWNLIAGERAKRGAAFRSSLLFFKIGKELLGDEGLGESQRINSPAL